MEYYYQIKDGVLEAYTGREETAVVPAGVHTIGKGAFKACTFLKQVLLPPGLQRIEEDAFKGCRKLEEIKIPVGVRAIGSYAFHRCHALRRLCLPDSVEEVGDCAFLYCDHLTEARLPGVKRLGVQMFLNDVRLEQVELSAKLPEEAICDMFTGCSRITEIVLVGEDGRESVRIPNAVEAAASGQEMPSLARRVVADILNMMELEGRRLVRFLINLKHVEIPEGVESLAKSCFFDKRGIVSVLLPGSLREIESRAFRNCISLERVEFGGSQVEIREDAFRNCTSLKTIRLADGREYQLTGLAGVMEAEGERSDPGSCKETEDVHRTIIPRMVHQIQKQVLGNFRLSGTILLKYLGAESRVVIPEGITRIGTEAFAGNEAIDRVILPESLTEIGAEAFRDCLLLQSISFPEGITRIGEGAFEHCVKLLRASLPPHLVRVEERTFRHCPALHEINFPEGLEEIGEGAFYGCISLKKLVFPQHLTTIGELAFYRCDHLKEVRIPAAAKQVQSLAFARSGVRRVQIAGSGLDFGQDVFGSCPRLKTLILEEGVRHIPDKLAYGCKALEQVVLPESLESVGCHALEGSIYLERWREECRDAMWGQHSEMPPMSFHAWEGQDRNMENSLPSGIFWDGQDLEAEENGRIVLSDCVRIVAGGAFYGNQRIREICLPETVHFIGRAAFAGCTGLQRLVLPAGIQELAPELCSGCIDLEEVFAVERSLTEAKKIKRKHGYVTIGERAFYQCQKLRRLSLEQTEYIGTEAFAGCTALEKGTVRENLWIEERAFFGTAYLEAVETEGTFAGFLRVGNVVVSGSSDAITSDLAEGSGNHVSVDSSEERELHLPEGITGIASYAFAGNRRLEKLYLPDSLKDIGEGAFLGCSGLREVRFSSAGQREGRAVQIGARAFEKCSSLGEIETDAAEIGTAAFSFCTALRRIRLPGVSRLSAGLLEGCAALEECVCSQAEAIGERSLCGCKGLKSFSFSRIRRIGSYAFSGCDCLKEAVFGDEIYLEPYAFRDCGRLARIELGESISLLEYAFSGCTALCKVRFQGRDWKLSTYSDICLETVPEVVRRIWDSALSCFEIEQEERLCAYQGAGKILHIPEGIKRIEAEVFRNCASLSEVTFPESLEFIGARAFHGTEWIERQKEQGQTEGMEQQKEELQAGMVVVKDMLLDASFCKGEVIVPASIRQVCGWAFANGLQIRTIRFRSERTRVGEYAFRNCVFLEKIILPDGTCVEMDGLSDREKELPPLARQAAIDRMNCFKTDENNVLAECTGNISVLRMAAGITAIGDGAFQDGNLLTKIFFAESVQRIGRRAFAGCKWLEEVCQAEEVWEIGEQAFSGCGRLRRIELSDRLERIGRGAFENCTALEEIRIPEGVTEIPEKAFYRCHSLKKLTLPSTIQRIGKNAFAFCGCQPQKG